MHILGITIDQTSKQKALEKVRFFLDSKDQYKLFTPNPEMLVDAQRDEYFKEVLNAGDLNICDGFGLQLLSGMRLHRIQGVDFMQDIVGLAEGQGKSVYFLGSGNEDVIGKLKLEIGKRYPKLKIAGANIGIKIDQVKADGRNILVLDEKENSDMIADIVMAQPDILFVAFGHGKQEKWIYENIADMPSVKIAMGVGGSFDFLSGNVKRAPKWIRSIGMEWLYRLILEPKRFKRIFKATFIFMWYVVSKKIT